MSPSSSSTVFLRVCIALGVFAFIAILTLPIYVATYFFHEVQRYDDCSGRSEKDATCTPSFLWPYFKQAEFQMNAGTSTLEN